MFPPDHSKHGPREAHNHAGRVVVGPHSHGPSFATTGCWSALHSNRESRDVMVRALTILFARITSRLLLLGALTAAILSQFYCVCWTMPITTGAGGFVVLSHHRGWLLSLDGVLSAEGRWAIRACSWGEQPANVNLALDTMFGVTEDEINPQFDQLGVTIHEPSTAVVAIRHWLVLLLSVLYFLSVRLCLRGISPDSETIGAPLHRAQKKRSG